MSNSIEQLKQDVKGIIDIMYSSQPDIVREMAMTGYTNNPAANTVEYWEALKQGLSEAIPGVQAAQKAAVNNVTAPAASKNNEAASGYNYEADGSGIVITKYTGSDKDINIPARIDGKTVTKIGEDAFYNKGLTSVTIPDTIVLIDENAFYRNPLTEISIPGSVVTIGEKAFERCGLVSLTIGDGVKTIKRSAFIDNKITSLKLGSTVETIEFSAFRDNKLAGTISIPANVKVIESSVFDGNELELAVVPDVTKYERSSFGNAKVMIASQHAFEESSAASGINYAKPEDFEWRKTKDGNSIIISEYKGKDTDLNIPPQINGLPVIEIERLGRKSFTSLIFPDSITKITSLGLQGELTSITFGKGLKEIGMSMFAKNKKLTQVFIPDNITTIGRWAFSDCGLTSVTIGKGVKSILECAFEKNNLTEIAIPDSVTFIQKGAFSRNKLKSLTLPKGITFVSSNSFSDNSLTNIELHNGITHIEDNAFSDNKLVNINLPDSIKHIGYNAFYGNKLKNLIIPDSVTSIGHQAFANNKLTGLTFGRGLKELTYLSFSYNHLTSVIIPENITSIDRVAFLENDHITCAAIPNTTSGDGMGCGDDTKNPRCLRGKILLGKIDFKKNPNGPYRINHGKPHDADIQAFHVKAALEAKALVSKPLQVSYPLRPLDDALNLSIAPKTGTPKTSANIKNNSIEKEDIMSCYPNHKIKEKSVKGEKLWEFEASNNYFNVLITGWKTEADAEKAVKSYKAKRWARKGSVTAHDITVNSSGNEGCELFKKGPSELTKQEVIAEYTRLGPGATKAFYTVKEIKPAGNWLWELEIESAEQIAVIIGWANNADARKAVNVYESMPEIQYKRRRNATAYLRGSGNINALVSFGFAADGKSTNDD